jgi:hypothetical protein
MTSPRLCNVIARHEISVAHEEISCGASLTVFTASDRAEAVWKAVTTIVTIDATNETGSMVSAEETYVDEKTFQNNFPWPMPLIISPRHYN